MGHFLGSVKGVCADYHQSCFDGTEQSNGKVQQIRQLNSNSVPRHQCCLMVQVGSELIRELIPLLVGQSLSKTAVSTQAAALPRNMGIQLLQRSKLAWVKMRRKAFHKFRACNIPLGEKSLITWSRAPSLLQVPSLTAETFDPLPVLSRSQSSSCAASTPSA